MSIYTIKDCPECRIHELERMVAEAKLRAIRKLHPIRVAKANVTMGDEELVYRADELEAILKEKTK